MRIKAEAICELFMPAVLKKAIKISFRQHQLPSLNSLTNGRFFITVENEVETLLKSSTLKE